MTGDGWEPLLHGIGFTGYRSFGDDWNPILMPSKVTVLAGQNNSGKSNVLRYVQTVLPSLGPNGANPPAARTFVNEDLPRGIPTEAGHTFGIALPLTRDGSRREDHPLYDSLVHVVESLALDGQYWARFELSGEHFVPRAEDREKAIAAWPGGSTGWRSHFGNVLRQLGGGLNDPDDVMSRLLSAVYAGFTPPPVATISSQRRVEATSDGQGENGWFSGKGIVEELAKLQVPAHGDWEEATAKWEAINRFVQTVLGDPDARIRIPHGATVIQIQTTNRVLPLSNWGSGTEQVIVLASAATLLTDSLVCVEEPETNLHPILQKKLISYLASETSNQYLVATHSSHLLDNPSATSHHLRLSNAGTQVTPAKLPHQLVEICHDLGYRPSDLMQANCVIWVEGPTDRIYIRRWLEIVDPELREGIEYSVMFYGGKLLAHLTVDQDALEDFIDLRRLNRFSAVVIDSDKTRSRAKISETKRRIKDEFGGDEAPGHVWVTACYTIENYVPREKLQAAVSVAHPGKTIAAGDEQWSNPLKGSPKTESESAWNFDKIAVAREVEAALDDADLDRFDLRAQLRSLSRFIRQANGLD